MHQIEEIIGSLIAWLELGAEVIGAVIVGVGLCVGAYLWVRTMFTKRSEDYLRTRRVLSRFLILALEFQLAADILATAAKPSWEQLGRLGAIAVIRTFLNYFLSKEVKEIEEEEDAVAKAGGPSQA